MKGMRMRIRTTMAALGLIALAACAQGGAMAGVSEQVQVASKGGKVIVTLTLANGSAAPVHVPKALYKDKELFGRHFTIREQGGAELEYLGPMVKRGAYTKDDYLAVKPGGKHSNSIDITASYGFKPGTHTYQLSYEGAYVADLAKIDAPTPLAVAPVTFTHTAK
jgi:hypothetical protein